MDVENAAEHFGVSGKTVQEWCRKGLIPGVRMVNGSRSGVMRYEIPNDAKRPVKKTSSDYIPPSPKAEEQMSRKEITEYIRLHAGRLTYAQLKKKLGISSKEIRRIYDELHNEYGI